MLFSDSVDVVEKIVEPCTMDASDLENIHAAPSMPARNETESVEGGNESVEAVYITFDDVGKSRKRRNKFSSSSKDDARSFGSGPWNVDWLQNIQKGDIGLISSKN